MPLHRTVLDRGEAVGLQRHFAEQCRVLPARPGVGPDHLENPFGGEPAATGPT